ncbi:hypothetical protein LTR16_000339 [Cryomyces antarcticus]|uniref:FMN hydroxy acid dehydrogenase domain-containing protein n=1 Tax=Cryomyces antarcticus TaxID=329879 RepID=A0ABR0LR08_9PEZI|nr:hypothetical protein LTR16_000339 [Cryomyces antarcticus]
MSATQAVQDPHPKARNYGAYQSEIYAHGMFNNILPTVTTDPNKLEEQAKKNLGSRSYNYVAGGAGERATMDANRLAFRQWKMVPRMLRQTTHRDLRVELFGQTYDSPLLVAPVGVQQIFHEDKETGVAEIAADLGVPYILSTASSASIEDGIGDQTGFSDPVFRRKFADKHGKEVEEDVQGAALEWQKDVFSGAAHTWDQLELLKKNWAGPIVLKGIQHPDDALKAVEAGVDGIICSNHGGRQLDGAVGSLEMLPEIVEAVGDKVTVLFDSGVRTGVDVIKALCLGAKAVLIGRPWVYGLAIAGKQGAKDALKGILADLDQSMGLSGIRTVADCDRSMIRRCQYPGDRHSSN